MSSIIQFFPILAILLLLNHLIHTYAGNFPTPRSPIDKIANYEHCYSGMHVVSQDSTHSATKLRKLVFGRVNTFATAVTIVITILNIVVYKLREIHEANLREKYKPSEQSCRRFLLADILSATKNFDDSLVIGQGGFGKVYRGVIDDGTITVAIKRLDPKSKQGAPEFKAEIEMLSRIRHSNIVSLIGYCHDCDEMILIYNYVVLGTLADNLHINRTKSVLPWAQRVKICIGAARGLDYLHTGTGDRNRIIHRDVKSSNILLGENWTAKVSDFGMSKIGPTNQLYTHVSTNVKGTYGYVDPEYFLTHQLTRKSDVYAFGVVLFEVLCGRRAVDLTLDVEQRGLPGWAQECIKEGKLDQIIDPSLRGQILSDSLAAFAQIADQCLHMFSTKRPTMAEVVVALELALTKQERTDFEEEFFINAGDYCDNQENAEPSIKAEAVIDGDCNNLENADSSVKEQVIIDGACNNQEDTDSPVKEHVVINSNNDLQLDNASKKESRVKPARRTAFTKMVRKFFFGKGRVISAQSEEKPTRKSKSNNNNGENVMLSSKDGDNFQHVPPSGHIGELNLKIFTYAELKAAAQNFRISMIIADGRFGMVFKGWIDEKTLEPSRVDTGMTIAVKRIDLTFPELMELKSKVEFWGNFSHPNLVKIVGYCFENFNFFLVQEYMEEGSLESHLFRIAKFPKPLPWVTRLKIAIDTARGLACLHASEKDVIYHQFKTSNILLDGDFNAKVVDFELAQLGIGNNDFDSNAPSWLIGNPVSNARTAPEYTVTGNLTLKSDVYGFGVVLLELLTGQRAIDQRWPFGSRYLVEWCMPLLFDRRKLDRLIDPHLKGQYTLECAFEYAALVQKCVDSDPENRPPMEEVLKTLEHIDAINMKRLTRRQQR